MGEQQAAKVRHALMELRDIDLIEQESVIHEFVGRPAQNTGNRDTGVEVDASLSAKFGNGPAISLRRYPPIRKTTKRRTRLKH